jgi:hypothetical protein
MLTGSRVLSRWRALPEGFRPRRFAEMPHALHLASWRLGNTSRSRALTRGTSTSARSASETGDDHVSVEPCLCRIAQSPKTMRGKLLCGIANSSPASLGRRIRTPCHTRAEVRTAETRRASHEQLIPMMTSRSVVKNCHLWPGVSTKGASFRSG